MKKLRNQIADQIEKKLSEHQRIVYNHRDSASIEIDQKVFLNLADSIIPMVKAELNKLKPSPKGEGFSPTPRN